MSSSSRSVSSMWEEYLISLGEAPETSDKTYQSWCFGSAPDQLAELTRSGIKRATASLHFWYLKQGETMPKPGDLSIVTNSSGNAACVIQTTKVTILPFCNVTPEFAFREGEGDKTLQYWQNAHRAFFTKELAELGLPFEDDMAVVCEEFHKVFP